MANEPDEKQPAHPPAESGAESSEHELGPDMEWHLRAHPPAERKPPSPPAAAQPPKPAAPAAAAPPPSPPPAQPPKPAVPATPAAPAQPPAAAASPPPSGVEPPKPPAPPAVAAPPKPAAPPPKKEEPPKPVPLESELVKRLKARFGEAIREAWLDRKQAIVVVAKEKLGEVARYCRDDEKFDMLTDLTAVDWPKREKRFDIILNLYSFAKNERLRLKVHAGENESVPSAASVWPAANWLERECFDMFGIVFEGHPDLRRILLPDEWQGHPLRKDYDILLQDTAWVRENLGIESGQ